MYVKYRLKALENEHKSLSFGIWVLSSALSALRLKYRLGCLGYRLQASAIIARQGEPCAGTPGAEVVVDTGSGLSWRPETEDAHKSHIPEHTNHAASTAPLHLPLQ